MLTQKTTPPARSISSPPTAAKPSPSLREKKKFTPSRGPPIRKRSISPPASRGPSPKKTTTRKTWKDVVQYRTAERGDTIFALDVPAALARHAAAPAKVETANPKKKTKTSRPAPAPSRPLPCASTPCTTSPDGRKLFFLSNAINQRQEKYEDVELYTVDLTDVARAPSPSPASAGSATNAEAQPHRITKNTAVETHPRWANDSRHIIFTVEIGDVSGPYRDLQPHLYWVDTEHAEGRTMVQRFHRLQSTTMQSHLTTSSPPPASAPKSKSIPPPSPRTHSTKSPLGPAPTPQSRLPRTRPKSPSSTPASASPTKST